MSCTYEVVCEPSTHPPLALVTAQLCRFFCCSLDSPPVLIFLKVDLSIPARLLFSQPGTSPGSAGPFPLLHSGGYHLEMSKYVQQVVAGGNCCPCGSRLGRPARLGQAASTRELIKEIGCIIVGEMFIQGARGSSGFPVMASDSHGLFDQCRGKEKCNRTLTFILLQLGLILIWVLVTCCCLTHLYI